MLLDAFPHREGKPVGEFRHRLPSIRNELRVAQFVRVATDRYGGDPRSLCHRRLPSSLPECAFVRGDRQ